MIEVSFGDRDSETVLEHVKTVPFRKFPTLLKLAVDINGSFDTSTNENGPMVCSFAVKATKKHFGAKLSQPGILKSQQICEALCIVQVTSKLSSRQTR